MQKRDAICEAALELFAEQGIEKTTIRNIADQANASEGALYRHFDGKADLAAWLFDRCAGELRTRLDKAAQGASTPEERLETLVRSLFDFYASRPSSCKYLLSRQPSKDNSEGASPTRLFAEAMGSTHDETGPPPTLRAGWILAMVQRTVRFLKAGTLNVDDQTAINQTVEAALHLANETNPTDGPI